MLSNVLYVLRTVVLKIYIYKAAVTVIVLKYPILT